MEPITLTNQDLANCSACKGTDTLGGGRFPLVTSMAPRQRVRLAALCIGYQPLDPQQRGGGGVLGTTGGAEKDGLVSLPTLPD